MCQLSCRPKQKEMFVRAKIAVQESENTAIYTNMKLWPVLVGKSPGNAHALGIDLRKWMEAGV